ncbi:MAG: hypothetical protein Q7S83_02050 [bacterium]|nr:hypothetical protein [bacterium]
MIKRTILAATLVPLAGLLQNTGLFSVLGIKPNLLLAVLVAASFFVTSFPVFIFLVVESILFLRFESGFQLDLLIWVFLLAIFYFIGRVLPWRQSVNNLALAASAIIIFYLIADFGYLIGAPLAVGMEIFYTSIFSLLFYDLLRQLGDNEENIFKR